MSYYPKDDRQQPLLYPRPPFCLSVCLSLLTAVLRAGHEHNVSSVQFFGSDGLVTASRDKTIRIWELSTGFCTSTLSGHSDWVRKARISDCGGFMASVSNDQVPCRVWSAAAQAAP